MLPKFEPILDKHLGQIQVVRHEVDLIRSEKRQSHSVPYRAALLAREIESYDIDKMFAMNVIEPIQTESPSPTVFLQKISGRPNIAWTIENLMR